MSQTRKVALTLAALACATTGVYAQQVTIVGSPTNIPLTSLAAQAADTVVANGTAGSASPTAVSLTSCSTSASALNYSTSTHLFSCNTAIVASSAATATTATNTTNVATTSTTTNAVFYPLFVASSSNSNQAASLNSTLTYNPSTKILSNSLMVLGTAGGTPTASSPLLISTSVHGPLGLTVTNGDNTDTDSYSFLSFNAGSNAATMRIRAAGGADSGVGSVTATPFCLLYNNACGATLSTANLFTLAGQLNVTSMTQTAAAQTGTVCYNSGTGAVNYDATLGCLTSLEELKDIRSSISPTEALNIEGKLNPFWFSYKPGKGFVDLRVHAGLGAHATEAADPLHRLVGYDSKGHLAGVRYADSITSLNVAAIKGLMTEIANLRTENARLRAANDNEAGLLRQMNLRLDRLEHSAHTRQARN